MKGDPAEATCSSRGHDRWDNAKDALSCRYESVVIARDRVNRRRVTATEILTECYSFSLFSEPWVLPRLLY